MEKKLTTKKVVFCMILIFIAGFFSGAGCQYDMSKNYLIETADSNQVIKIPDEPGYFHIERTNDTINNSISKEAYNYVWKD